MQINRITLAEGDKIEIDFEGLWPSMRFEVEYTEQRVSLHHRSRLRYEHKLSPKAPPPVRPPVTVPSPIDERGPSLLDRLFRRRAV